MFDVVDELIRLLKDLRFVFSGEVVEPRVSKRLREKSRMVSGVLSSSEDFV